MRYPIVKIKTEDNIPLYGMLLEPPQKTDTLFIAIHGTASNFYENDFMEAITKKLYQKKISLLLTNNRGAYILQAYPLAGAAIEKFEDCVKDIDAWIFFALKKGYKKIILQGHSLGAEKVVYYMNYGIHKKKISAVVLLAPSDSFGYERAYSKNFRILIKEAESMIKSGKEEEFLRSTWLSYSGIMPRSALSYYNFLKEDSELSKALPFHNKTLPFYQKIKIPILAVIGDQTEYTLLPVPEALELMKKDNPLTEDHQLKNCDHDFNGKEEELADIVAKFVENTFEEKIR